MEQPQPPGEYDCCENGCEPCVWDHYYAELAEWRKNAQNSDRQNPGNNSSTSQPQTA